MFRRFIFASAMVFTFLLLNLSADTLENSDSKNQALKEKKLYSMGEKVFEKNCPQDLKLDTYTSIEQLQVGIKEKCQPLKSNHFEALSLYLWDVKRVSPAKEAILHIHVDKEEKCPVCGMFTYKYPRWAAQIFYLENEKEKHYSFDGVKDLLKFYFDPLAWGNYTVKSKEDITKILVTDYYSQKAVDATKAYYVIGSDAYGPMGHELIPFENEADAKTFYRDHKGTKITHFKEITPEEVYKLDE